MLPVKINLPLSLKHALVTTELLCPGTYPLLHNLLLMHTRVSPLLPAHFSRTRTSLSTRARRRRGF